MIKRLAEINIVTAEQLKLKDETKRLCSENGRLKESLNESQQLLHDQKAEINLVKENQQKLKDEIRHLCPENDRLQNSVTKTQQLLRDQEN